MSNINSENIPLLKEDTQKSNYLAVPEEEEEDNPLSIYNENDILFCVKEEPKNNTVRDRIGHMLNTTKWNITILLMIACDVFIVVLELFVQLDDKKQCPACPINGGNPPINSFDMSEANHEKLANFVHHISFLSDIFLFVFTTEVFLHLYCFGFSYLFEAWINFVDSLTVITTFIVTIAITFYSASEEAQGLVDILIILRFWRIFCLVESVVNATQLEANLRFKEVLIDLNAERRILENRKDCYAKKLTELGYDLSKLENEYLFPEIEQSDLYKKPKEDHNDDIILNVPNNVEE